MLQVVQSPLFLHEWNNLLFLGLLAAASIAVYFPVLGHGFVQWDDYQLVVENLLVRSFSPKIFWTFDPELYVPLTLLSFQIEYALAGPQVFLFHLTNLILHVANVGLIFFLLKKFFKEDLLAFAGALLFALHPIQAEAVSWISARKELLMTFFFLSALLAALRGEKKWTYASWILFLCALLSKVAALTFPFVLALFLLHRKDNPKEVLKTASPYLGLSILFGIIGLMGRDEALKLLTPLQTLLLAFRSFTFYLQQFFVPLHFSAIYPAPTDLSFGNSAVLLSIVIVIALIIATWVCRKKYPLVSIGFFFFAFTIAPSFLAYGKSGDVTLAADRYAYLPLIGLVILVLAGCESLSRRWRRFAPAAIIALVLLLSVKTFTQAQTWRTSETLFANVLKHFPDSHIALNNLGFVELERNQTDKAIAYFEKALEKKPIYPDALVSLGAAYGKKNMLREAEVALTKALSYQPDHLKGVYNLAGVHMIRGNTAEAIRLYKKATELGPLFAPSYWHLARTYLKIGKRDEARETYQRLIQIDPSYKGRSPELDAL